MKTKVLIIVLHCLIPMVIYSQEQCGVIDISNRQSPSIYCGDILDYQPDPTDKEKCIRMVFHIMQKADGSGNFLETDPDQMDWLNSYETWANYYLSNIEPPLLCGPTNDPYISDSKIRFKIVDIQFHQDNSGWNNLGSWCGSYCYNNYGVMKEKVLNVFFISIPGTVGGCGPGYNGEEYNFVTLMNDYEDYITYGERPWIRVTNLIHEVGHGLNLHHTWLNSQLQMFPDIYYQTQESWCNPSLCTPPVQYCSNNIMSYSMTKRFLSPMQLGFIHKELTYSWRYKMLDADEYNASQSIEITNDETWDIGKVVGGDITISNGATLTILCDVFMCKDGQIIVEPGSRLIVDGGRITNKRKEFWKGIKVLGNRNQNQYPIAQPTYQGMVILSDGATIEFAHDAISVGEWDDWNASGGVIIANNSNFINNRRSIEYYSYDNVVANTILPNRGYFYNCNFEINDEFNSQNGLYPFRAHVTAWEVEGVQFNRCKFKNLKSDNTWSDGNRNRAIFALSANLKINGTCNNPTSQGIIESESPDFTGFQKAIELTGSSEVYTSFIQKCSFDNNLFGVSVTNMPNVSITRNLFSLGSSEISGIPSNNQYSIGVQVEKCTGFEVEENYFKHSGQDLPSIGISTLNINYLEQINDNNEIYRNRMDELSYAIQSTGVNREIDRFTGVQFLCNKFFASTLKDIDIMPNPDFSQTIDAIRSFQGSYDGTITSRKAAGNLFSSTNDFDFFQINNECNSTIFYQYNNSLNNLGYPTKISEKVLALGAYTTPNPITVSVNSCPSHISNGIEYPYTLQKKESLLAEFNSEKTAYWNLYYNYLQLIDGGSTPNVLFEIQNTWPQQAWDLRNDLLQISPFLSKEALLEAANSGILPDAILLEIILANPDGSRDDDLLEQLRNNIPNPLPEYMIELIRNSWTTETSRTLIELGLAEHGAAKDYTFSRLLTNTIHVADSISKNYSEIRTFLVSRNELSDRYAIIDSYVAEKDFDSANSELYDIEQDFDFSDREVDEHENYIDYVALLEGLYSNYRTIFEFDSLELAQLTSIANSATGLSSDKARNILCFAYDLCENNYANPSTPRAPKSASNSAIKPNELIKNLNNKVIVSPNPIHDFAEFSWDLQQLESGALLEVYDITGKKIYQFLITDKIGSHVWGTSGLNSGNYNYRINENGKILASGKLTII